MSRTTNTFIYRNQSIRPKIPPSNLFAGLPSWDLPSVVPVSTTHRPVRTEPPLSQWTLPPQTPPPWTPPPTYFYTPEEEEPTRRTTRPPPPTEPPTRQVDTSTNRLPSQLSKRFP